MDESKQVELGMYCHRLLEDDTFCELVRVCEAELSATILDTPSQDDRDTIYNTYQGMKLFINMMRQFVLVKDQIRARNEEEDNE